MYRSFVLFVGLVLTGCLPSAPSPLETRNGTPAAPVELIGVLPQDVQVQGSIRVTGDLLIPAGRTLRILAASSVDVLGTDSTRIDPEYLAKGTEILVRGTLEVVGEKGQRVRFRAAEKTPRGEGWAGIEIIAGGRADLRYLDIRGAETALLLIDAQVKAQQLNLSGSRYGALVQRGGRLFVAGGRISGGDAGLLCFDGAALHLSDLQIVDNQEEGLYLARGCQLVAEKLLSARNDLGLVAPAMQELNGLRLQHNRVNFKPLANDEGER